MNQLKKDYISLKKSGFNKPSLISSEDKYGIDQKTIEVIIRYKHLLLNKLFLKNVLDNEKGKALPTGKNNGKKYFFKKWSTSGISKEIISYPLEEIYLYIENNLNSLKGENIKQIDVARKFGIKNLGTFYRIVKTLGFLKKIEWKLINLPVDKFEKFNIELKGFLIKNNNLKGQDILDIGKKNNINNPEVLYSAISALGIAKKYQINKVKINSIGLAKEIYDFINKNYNDDFIFDRESVLCIKENFKEKLGKNNKDSITKVTSLLRFYGYKVNDIRKYKN